MATRQLSGTTLTQPFFATEQQRQALARERFFEEGIRPSGLVSEGVIQSWARCIQARREPHQSVGFNAVTRSRIHSVLSRNRMLLDAAVDEFTRLETTLAGTACQALLTDASGVLIHATRSNATHEQLLPLATRVGVNLAEESIGTTAPGMVVRTGQPCTVRAAEHFFESLQILHCAAAPIRDIHQQVAGVLDVSIESQPFGFDAASMIALHATSIENRLLQAQSREHIVVRLQTMPSLLGTPMEGLAGVNSEGMLTWVNSAAARVLGVPPLGPWSYMSDILGLDLWTLTSLTRSSDAHLHRLPSGLAVWLVAHMQSPDGAKEVFSLRLPDSNEKAAAETQPLIVAPEVAPAAPTRLRDSDRKLIERTLAECGGNVSKAARLLGVSRGLVYRHMNMKQRTGDDPQAAPDAKTLLR